MNTSLMALLEEWPASGGTTTRARPSGPDACSTSRPTRGWNGIPTVPKPRSRQHYCSLRLRPWEAALLDTVGDAIRGGSR